MYHLNMVNNTGNKMEDDVKLVFICGSYLAAMNTPVGERAQVISQTTETGAHMLSSGRSFHKVLPENGVKYIFCNNDLFFYGIRLAVKNGDIKHNEVEFYFYPDKDAGRPLVIEINSEGRFEHWPDGFFDAYDRALNDMLA
jgi:hypothetical protein